MKVLVLGLDGATFDLLGPLMDEGLVPTLKKFCDEGASGPLRTIFPPVTGPAWLALATGLNPGKTGVFDYINRKAPHGVELTPISSAYYEDLAVWDHLGRNGFKVGVFNYPTLSPPPKVNGFSVSGMGGYKKEHLCYPEELERELHEITNGFEVQLNLRSEKYRRNVHVFMDDLNRVIVKQAKALKYLASEKEWDFLFAVFHFTDWMQHLLWKHIDPTHPLHDPMHSPGVREKFNRTWQYIDTIIGDLIGSLQDTNFIIVSDHGAGPIDSAFYPNAWLQKKGWLSKRNLGWRSYLAEKLKPLSVDVDNKYLSAALRRFKTKVLGTRGTMELMDLENSLAYSPEHAAMFGCINLTGKGRQQPGFREALLEELRNLPDTEEGVERIDIHLPEDLYDGPYIDHSPDILFVINDFRSSVEIDFHNEAFVPRPSLEMRTGGHLPFGVFMAHGPAFMHARVENVSVLDIAPTVLALFNEEIPSDMDGLVIESAIRREVLSSLNIRTRTEDRRRKVSEKGDLEEMKKTLQSLGYM